MRLLAVLLMFVSVALLPTPAGANHDPDDDYVTIGNGSQPSFYVDDGFPSMIFRESNGIDGLQRGFDNSGHLGHPNHDQRIF